MFSSVSPETFGVKLHAISLDIRFKFNILFSLLFFFRFVRIQGTAENRIVFTTQPDSIYSDSLANDPQAFGARLVDGPSPLAGRLQFFYEQKWRSVCTNSRK